MDKVILKCPKCKKEINHLHNVSALWHQWDMTLDKEGYADYEERKSWSADRENTWMCPECDEDLFTDENDAIKFLKGDRKK